MTQNGTYYGDITNIDRESVSTSSTTTAAKWSPDQIELLQNYYEDNLGTKMPFPIAKLAIQAEKAGMQVETFMEAIDETMFAPRPSPYYLRAVVLRWLASGILTVAQVAHDREVFSVKREQNRRTRFSQRDYKGTDWGNIFVDVTQD